MKYYKLETSHNLKVMGRQPFQIQNFRKGYDKNAENSIYKFERTNLKIAPEKGPDLEGMIMEKGAKWTDNVNCIPLSPNFAVDKKSRIFLPLVIYLLNMPFIQ